MATNGAAPPIPSQLDAILRQDAQQKRVPVHTFDPDASPQEKAAAAGRARDQLRSIVPDGKKPAASGKGMHTGLGFQPT